MATPRTTIPDLPEQTAPVDTDLLVVQNGATTKKMTVGRLTTASSSAVDAHIADLSGAHAASAISAIPSVAPFDGTDVQTQLSQGANAIASMNAAVGANTTGLANHLADTSDAHDASAVSVVAGAGIVATDVQGALVELQGEVTTAQTGATTASTDLAAHISDASAAHAASAVSVLPAGNLTSTDAQAAFGELQSNLDGFENTILVGKADKTTSIATTAPLTGGGDLSANRTLDINTFTVSVKGAVPPPGTVTGNYLKDDGTWAAPAGVGGGITTEDAVDAVATALVAGNNIDVTYNDASNTITVDVEVLTSADVGLGNVTNTSDANKPVSTAQQTALDLKADKTTTITPTAPLTGGGSLAANRTLDISTFTLTVKGAVPPPTTATGKFLKDDGTWAVAGGSTAQTIEAVAGTTYTVVTADANKLKSLTGTATITLPSAGPATGERVDFVCVGGPATFALGGGATWAVAPTPSAVARAIGSFVTAIKMGATTWALTGDLA